MKKLFLIGGTMGVGKTAVSQILKNKLPCSVFLDGDWCWDAHPFVVNDETKKMVMQNICFVLNNFIRCSSYENIIFCWVMHEQEIIDDIISGLDASGCKIVAVSLICSEQELIRRISKDVSSGKRAPDVLERSIARMPNYQRLDTVKIDTSEKSAEDVADILAAL